MLERIQHPGLPVERGYFVIDHEGWTALMMDDSLHLRDAIEIARSRGYIVEDKKVADA